MSDKVYLKPNVVFEPLVDNWYAWPHLISPATNSRNLTGRHLKIKKSYLQAPLIHAAAVKNPKMRGGPFIDYGGKRVDEIRELYDTTKEKRSNLLDLSDALDELDAMLKEHAQGFGLKPLYDKVPEILKGYVELVYDLNHNPSYRLYEPLLYNSEFYHEDAQSVAFWLTNNDSRPFVLSTPRLPEDHVVHKQIPFKSPALDELAKMKKHPRPLREIMDIMGIEPDEEEVFRSFFTDEEPEVYVPYRGDKIRMRYFGHACIFIETATVSILVDPLISYYGYQADVNHFTDADLPDEIDYVLITHNHQDHILFETLLPLRHKIKNIVVPTSSTGFLQEPDVRLMFNHIGFDNIINLRDMESVNMGDCTITGIPFMGEHADLNIPGKLGYHVKIEDFSLMFLADSCNLEPRLYDHVKRSIGGIDVLFLGMECDGAPLSWLYGPLLPQPLARDKDNSRRLSGSNYEQGMPIVDVFRPKEVYVYAMGQEPWVEFISSIKYDEDSVPIIASDKLVANCAGRGILAERLYGEKELLYERVGV